MQIDTIMRIKKNNEYLLHAEFIDFQINQYTVFFADLRQKCKVIISSGEK